MTQVHVMTVFGTRPEAIKMAPIVHQLQAHPATRVTVCVTGQHREMLDQALAPFGIVPDIDLNLMRSDQGLSDLTAAVLTGMTEVFATTRPAVVLVHGDTTTSFAAALAAFYAAVPVAHIEAGLRTGNVMAPWPEEANRRLTARLASVHFAPTTVAAENLRREFVPEADVLTTGNTVVDALQWTLSEYGDIAVPSLAERFPFITGRKRLILVTGHRRENLDGGLRRICRALVSLAKRNDVTIVYPVHLNPAVVETVESVIGTTENVHLIDPLGYVDFVCLMSQADLIISDSGGIQEEAPYLGVPVLVTRNATERPEAVDCGAAELVGTDPDLIVARATKLLDDHDAYTAMSTAESPFGDGTAAAQIVTTLVDRFSD